MSDVVKRTGVIGLGAMGLQMAQHMAAKGFAVAGYDVLADANTRAKQHGVKICGSPAEVGDHAEVAIVMVATDAVFTTRPLTLDRYRRGFRPMGREVLARPIYRTAGGLLVADQTSRICQITRRAALSY